jgi:hypothetical protein
MNVGDPVWFHCKVGRIPAKIKKIEGSRIELYPIDGIKISCDSFVISKRTDK